MSEKLENRNIQGAIPLVPPREIKARLPLSEVSAELVGKTRNDICDIIHGRDNHRVVVVIGPCSVHDPEAAFDYATRLHKVARATADQLVIVMRTYFEK